MPTNSNGLDELIWKTYSPYSGLLCEKTCYKIFTNLGKIGGWKYPKTSAWSRNFN